MVVAGLCPQFGSHDEGAEEFLTGQAAQFYLCFQMRQFLFVEMKGDNVISFSHMDLYDIHIAKASEIILLLSWFLL